MMKTAYLLLLLATLAACSSSGPAGSRVVATSSWTAAYALEAGAGRADILAPVEMEHPTEYELRPGDIQRVKDAELFIYAGYEVIAEQLKEALELPAEKMLRVRTDYSLAAIDSSVLLIADRMGTRETALANLEKLKDLFDSCRSSVHSAGLDTVPALVQFFQLPFAREMGMNVAGVFGPGPAEPSDLLELTRSNAGLILDNVHSPSGGALKETLENAHYGLLVNFPGANGTRSLEDVLRYNTGVILGLK